MKLHHAICILIALAWLVFVALTGPVAAQTANCGERGHVAHMLADRWGESLQARGLGVNGALVEVWANPETGSWTITATAPGGQTCLAASGADFALMLEALPSTDEGA